jgi:hypothetical protein
MSVSGPKNPLTPGVRSSTPASAPPATPKADPVIRSRRAEAPASSFSGHTAAIDLGKTQNAGAIIAQGKVVADTVMKVIGTYDKSFLLATGGVQRHVQEVATRFLAEADHSTGKGSAYEQLKTKFPGAHILLVGTAALKPEEQVYYVVRAKDGTTHKFESAGGKLKEAPAANGEVFMASELGPGKKMKIRVPEVRFLINPTLPPDYGVGRQIVVVTDTPIKAQMKDATDVLEGQGHQLQKEVLKGDVKGEDGKPMGIVLSPQREEKGVILKYDGNGKYDVEVTAPDGKKTVVQQTEDQIRTQNDPTVFSLHGGTYDDVALNVDTDPSLKKFCADAQAIIDKDIPKTGTPDQIAAGQKQALTDLTIFCNKTMSYPDEGPNVTDPAAKKWAELTDSHSNWNPMKLGDLIDCGRGVCRHQAILMQVCCQLANIDSRMVTAQADDDKGQFRGFHAFLETTLDDGTQYLTDPTWYDAGPTNVNGRHTASPKLPDGTIEEGTPLFDTLYFNARRQVLPTWNDNDKEDHTHVKFRETNDPVIDGGGVVTAFEVVKGPDATGSADDATKAIDAYIAKNRGAFTLGAKADLGNGLAPYKLGNAWAQDFKTAAGVAATLVTSPKGTFALVAPARELYAQADNAAKLGAPVGQLTQISGALEQRFEHGAISRPASAATATVTLDTAPTPPATIDTSKFLDGLRMKEFGSDYKQWWPNWDPHSAPQTSYDKMADSQSQANPKAAAAYLSLGIEFGNSATPELTKRMWTKLAECLTRVPGMDAEAAQAKQLGG